MTYTGGQGGQGPALYVVHTAADVEAVALLVDFFEASVAGLEGLVGCSALPGYPPAADAGADLLLAVFRGDTVPPALVAELVSLRQGRGQASMLSLSAGGPLRAPPELCDLPLMRLHDAVLSSMVDSLGVSVARRYRESEQAAAAREELMLCAYGEHDRRDSEEAASPSTVAPVVARLRGLDDGDAMVDSARSPARTFSAPGQAPPDRTPASDTVALGGGPMRISTLVPKPRPPSALLSANAGAALADAVYRGTFGEADLIVLDGEFAEFVHGLGGDWFQLRASGQPAIATGTTLVDAVDSLLCAQSEDDATVAAWYGAGYQLARFCNLCADESAEDARARSAVAQARGRAWNAFWDSASALSLPEHTVTALSALLEDADAPGGPRVETVQCLEVLRNGAYDWDCERRLASLAQAQSQDGVVGVR